MSAPIAADRTLGKGDLLRWSMRLATKQPATLAVALLATLLVVAVELVKPWPLKMLVDNGISGKPLSGTAGRIVEVLPGTGSQNGLIAWCAAATVVVFVLGWAATTLAAVSAVALSQRMTYGLADELYDHLQHMSPTERGRRRTGDLLRRVVGDTGSLATIVVAAVIPALTAVLSLGATLLVMWRLNLPLTLLTLAVVPLLGITIWVFAERMERTGHQVGAAYGDLYTTVEERLSTLPAIQAFAREPEADLAVWRAGESTLAATLSATRAQVDFKIVVGTAAAIGTAGVLLVGGWQAMAGSVSVGTLLVFISYVAALYAPLAALTYSSSAVLQATAGAQRVHELLSQRPAIVDAPNAQPMLPIAGKIEFRGVRAGYEPGVPVLQHIDLTIDAGELVTLAGPSGIGKSTLVSLIPRFLDPWKGSVRIDDIDLREVALASLRGQIGVVPQDTALLPVSIAENIAFGDPDASDDAIRAAARLAQADGFIEELPDGYQTVVGERGATLSGGQRQRIAIARALLIDPPILILDEPTSALDPETEDRLLAAIKQSRVSKTTILISHRPLNGEFAGRIVLVGNGEDITQTAKL
jgi:ATP-binding cassette subfamily B protein/subfamily B ATP-binding cassette protein MsbA